MKITHLFLAQAAGSPMRPVAEARAVESRGFDGDRHARRPAGGDRQLLVMDAANLRALRMDPGVLKENVVVEGLTLGALPPGQRLALGGRVVIELTGACVPCRKVEAVRPGLLAESWGRRGQLAKVIAGGAVREGDPVRLLDVNPDAKRPIIPKLP